MTLPKTRLSQRQIEAIDKAVMKYLKSNPFVTNKILRSITGINYDQAIQFFNTMLDSQRLQKEGVGSGTRYVLPHKASK